MSMPSKVEWPSFTFPPLNLWNIQKHNEIVKLINEYYYEHYKWLWEEDTKDTVEYSHSLDYNNKNYIIRGRIKV